MLKTILREILIFFACVSVLPVVIVVILLQNESPEAVFHMLLRVVLGGGLSRAFNPLALWAKVLAPYAFVQAIRAYRWSQRSTAGRRWANLYFLVILVIGAGWSFFNAWELFYLMYVIGDMPEALGAFLEIELYNVAILVICLFLSVYCAANLLDPARRTRGGPR